MFQFFRQLSKQFQTVGGKLNSKQKVVFFLVTILTVGIILGMMFWANEKPYVVLYSNLDPADTQAIRVHLEEQGIPYRLETDGTAVLVQAGSETGLRLDLVAEGIPASTATVGFEIFDRPNLGLTDYIQRVNYRRGLEGELARTLMTIEAIDRARVHIVLPEERLFAADQNATTASVIITLRAGAEISRENVQAIARLIAGSVEGLMINNINITDSFGNNLSRDINRDPLFVMTANQLEVQQEVENKLRREIETLLNISLGPDRSIVRVNVEMDFSQTTHESVNFNPEVQIPLAEERRSATGAVFDSIGVGAREENTITNYNIDQVNTHTVEDVGKVKRMSVSVTVDTSVSPQRIPDLEVSIRAAVGFNADRNDAVSIVRMSFDQSVRIEAERRLTTERREETVRKIIRYSLMAGGAFLFLIMLRSVFKSLDILLPKPKPKPAIDIEAEAIVEEITAEAQRRGQMLEQVARFAKDKPENVASLLQSWLIEEPK